MRKDNINVEETFNIFHVPFPNCIQMKKLYTHCKVSINSYLALFLRHFMRRLSDEKKGYSNIHTNFHRPHRGCLLENTQAKGKTAQPAAVTHTAPGGKLGHPHYRTTFWNYTYISCKGDGA